MPCPNEDRHRLILIKRNIVTVEPVAFLAMFANVLSSIASTSISIDKVCRIKLKIDGDICYAITKLDYEIDEYTELVSEYFIWQSMWSNVVACVLPCLLLLFMGGWSDMTGNRKIILLLPVIGRSLQIMNTFVNVILFYQIPLGVYVFFNEFFVNIFGGSTVMAFALITYVLVTNTEQYRVYRLVSLSVCAATGTLLGISFCRFLLSYIGYSPIMILSLCINALTSTYIIYKVSDPKRNSEQMMYDKQTISEFFKKFFSFEHIKATVEVISRKTPKKREHRLWLHIFSLSIIISIFIGEVTVLDLIAQQSHGWTNLQFQSYRTYSLTLSILGSLITVGVITKWLKCHDSVIGIVSSFSKIISSFVLCFVERQLLYIGPAIKLLNDSCSLAMFSLASKLLENKEIGKVNALVFLLGNLMRLFQILIYKLIHALTRQTLPGTVYLVQAAYTLPVMFVFIWLLIEHRRDSAT